MSNVTSPYTTEWNITTTVVVLSGLNDQALNASAEEDTIEQLYPLSLVIPFTIIYAITFVTGVVGNVSTCIVIAKNKCMHTATNYYLFSLAISDMLLLVSGLPPEMYRIWSPDHYVFGSAFCVLQGFAAETSANATVLTITAFTVERYLAICHPFLSHTMSKLSRAIRYIIAIWVIALCLAIPQAIQFGIEYEIVNGQENSHCTIVSTFFEHAFEISTFVFFVGPMTLITVLYIFIGIQLRKSKNVAGAQRASVNSATTSESRRRILRHTAAQNRVVKMLIAVVAAFFICWAPFHAQRLLAVYLSNASPEAQQMFFAIYTGLMYSSGVLYFLSTTVNPVLYHILSNKFRKAFKKTFVDICSSNHHSTNRPYRVLTKVPPAMRNMQRSVSEGVVEGVNQLSIRNDFTCQETDFLEKHHKNHHTRCNSKVSQSSRGSDFSSTRLDSIDSAMINKTRYMYKKPAKSKKNLPNEADDEHYLNMNILKMFQFFHKGNGYVENNPISNIVKQGSIKSNNTVSNSSLQDLDESEFSSSDLVRYMREVNEKL